MKWLPLVVLGLFSSLSLAAEKPLIAVARVQPESTADTRDMTLADPDKKEQTVHVEKKPIITDQDVETVLLSGEKEPGITVQLTTGGAARFSTATGELEGKRLAILLEGRLVSAPLIRTAPLGPTFLVTGISKESAERIVAAFARDRASRK